MAADSDLAEAITLVARSHQSAIWSRRRLANQVRSALREYYPAALVAFDDLTSGDAVEVLTIAATPAQGRSRHDRRSPQRCDAVAASSTSTPAPPRSRPHCAPTRSPSPTWSPCAYAAIVASLTTVIAAHNRQITELETVLTEHFRQHPDAVILRGQPGLGVVTGARALGEFGDDPDRYADAKARRNYAATSPLTVASGTRKTVRARHIRNRRLADALHWWAFNAITRSPGA